MIDLRNYLFKDVVLIDIDNKRWEGHVFSFHDAEDNDDNEYSIKLEVPDNNLIEFTKSEIISIKIV